jgi:predicted NBD/HSP70 family sugar kinase
MDGDGNIVGSEVQMGCGPLLGDSISVQKPMRQRIFEHVRAEGQAARADITRALGISPGSATTLTAELIQQGLLHEVAQPPRDHGRGRPPVALEIVPGAGHVIGIKLSHERHTALLTDFAGNMTAKVELATSLGARSLDIMLNEVDRLMARLLDRAGKSLSDISGVGIGLPGIIGHEDGHVRWSPLLIERDQDFGAVFSDRFGVPLFLENDANMLTLAELWFGAGRSMTDFAVVTIENGVGMGLVLNNQLYRGSFGVGLELGHTKVQIDGALCRCGQRGCLEAYLADYALAREASTALNYAINQKHSMQATLDNLFTEAKGGNAAALTVFRRAGRYLSLGLSNVMQLFDPALIILSGERMRYDYMFVGEVMEDVRALTLARGQQQCQVEIHSWGDQAWARGATARALTDVTDTMFGPEGRFQ